MSLQEQNNNPIFGSEGLAVRLVPLELKRYSIVNLHQIILRIN